MLYWSLIFLVVALISGVLGFGGVAAASVSVSKILFFIFIIAFVVSAIVHLARKADKGITKELS